MHACNDTLYTYREIGERKRLFHIFHHMPWTYFHIFLLQNGLHVWCASVLHILRVSHLKHRFAYTRRARQQIEETILYNVAERNINCIIFKVSHCKVYIVEPRMWENHCASEFKVKMRSVCVCARRVYPPTSSPCHFVSKPLGSLSASYTWNAKHVQNRYCTFHMLKYNNSNNNANGTKNM